ncbi:MAG: TolC family protein [Thermodesulfobacteriota bacterium]|nr:TolC family protein [Thermodesulfobacteriota bacterium]
MSPRVFFCSILIFFVWTTFPNAEEMGVEVLKKAKVLNLRSAITRGIQKNLDLRVEEINIPISREDTITKDAEFDPKIDASIHSLEQETPVASAFTEGGLDIYRETGGTMGIRKKFRFGLESRLSYDILRSMNNSSVDVLRPQYQNFLVLNITQPLLRDLGTYVNTADLRISRNYMLKAVEGYMDQARQIAGEVELLYYDLAEAVSIYNYRLESLKLANELFRDNRKKFNAGLVPITEVQEAETAVASRDEQVVFARQRLEISTNSLKDVLEIRPGDSLYNDFFVTEKISDEEITFPEFEKAYEVALKRRPDIKRQHIEIANFNINLEFYRNQKLPRLDLEATLGANGLSGGDRPVSFPGILSYNSHEGNYMDSLSRMADVDGYEWYVGLNFTYPLGNRAAKARYRTADQKKCQALYKLKRLEGKVETEIKNSLIVIERSLERIKVSGRFEKLAEITLNQEMKRLKEGISDTFRILDFQDDLIDARVRKVTALKDFNRGLALLYQAMGENLNRFNIIAKYKDINKETFYAK